MAPTKMLTISPHEEPQLIVYWIAASGSVDQNFSGRQETSGRKDWQSVQTSSTEDPEVKRTAQIYVSDLVAGVSHSEA